MKEIDPRHISIYPLDEPDLKHIPQFDCGDNEMNRFFKDECYQEQQWGLNRTYVLYYRGELSAFCSICADRISLNSAEREEEQTLPRNSVPAVKIARLGRDIRFKDFKFGRMLMEYIQFIILKMSREQLGIRFITLDAYEDRVSYYESLQFKENAQQDKRKETVSMRLDIYTEMTMNDQNIN